MGHIASIFSLRIASSTLQTTDDRLIGRNRFGSVVRGGFATGITMAWRQLSGIREVWRERLKILKRIGAMFKGFGDDTTRDGSRIGVEGVESSLDF